MLIREQLEKKERFSSSEQVIAEKILELKESIKNMSIRELACQGYVSTSVIMHLIRKLGFESYNNFKESYIEEIRYLNAHFESIDANVPFEKEDNAVRVCESIGELYRETVDDTLRLISYIDYLKAVNMIDQSKNIYVLCAGPSLQLGKIFCDRMMRVGKQVHVSENFNEQYYQSLNGTKDDCYIVITYSATTLKTSEYLQNLKNSRSKTILITSFGHERWKGKVDVILSMTTREKIYSNIATYTSTVSTMMILDLLYSLYFHKHFDQAFETKKERALAYESNRKPSSKIMEEE